MKQSSVPIDPAGRIVLPKDVRDELAIKPGDTLKISIEGSSVKLTPNKEAVGLVRKGHALVFSSAGAEPLTEETVKHVLKAAVHSGAEKIFTLNLSHFQNVAPKNISSRISAP